MEVKDKNGRPVEISVYGRYEDDIQIDEAYYLDTPEDVVEDVSDDMVEWISKNYASEIFEEWLDKQIAAAEAYADSLADR